MTNNGDLYKSLLDSLSEGIHVFNQVIGAVKELYDNSSKVEFVHKIEELEKCALLDPLTGLMKRRGLEMNLRSVFGVMQRYGWSYGIFFVDIDEFKRINDVYGHDIGDNVLKMVAKTLLNIVEIRSRYQFFRNTDIGYYNLSCMCWSVSQIKTPFTYRKGHGICGPNGST